MKGTTPRLEVELKARLPDPTGWHDRLEGLGAYAGEKVYRDTYFGPADVPADEVDPYRHVIFRLRSVGDSHEVTIKEKRVSEGVETSREVDFAVDAPAAFREFAARLGYRPFVEKEKRVRDYEVEGLLVQLVQMRGLGDFIEIEYTEEERKGSPEEGRRRVLDLFHRLGVPEDAIEPRLYIDLLRNR